MEKPGEGEGAREGVKTVGPGGMGVQRCWDERGFRGCGLKGIGYALERRSKADRKRMTGPIVRAWPNQLHVRDLDAYNQSVLSLSPLPEVTCPLRSPIVMMCVSVCVGYSALAPTSSNPPISIPTPSSPIPFSILPPPALQQPGEQ